MRQFRRFITMHALLLLTAVGIPGCNVLHDDLSKCDLYLQFRYDYNLSGEDWFSEQVEEVRVFVFNDNGYVGTFSDNGAALGKPGYRMAIPYALKGSTMVVWAGRTEDHYELPTLAAGDPIEKLTLEFHPQNDASALHLAPLWHSSPVRMTFSENSGTTQTVSLIRDTNDLSVSIHLAGGITANPYEYDIRLTGANGSYDCHNQFLPGIPQLTYTPAAYGTTTAELYTLRIVKETPLLFSAAEKASGRPILAGGKQQIDLTEFLLASKPQGMGDQEYLDRRYLWDIRLGYDPNTYMAVSITINGWTHWFQITDL